MVLCVLAALRPYQPRLFSGCSTCILSPKHFGFGEVRAIYTKYQDSGQARCRMRGIRSAYRFSPRHSFAWTGACRSCKRALSKIGAGTPQQTAVPAYWCALFRHVRRLQRIVTIRRMTTGTSIMPAMTKKMPVRFRGIKIETAPAPNRTQTATSIHHAYVSRTLLKSGARINSCLRELSGGLTRV